MKLRSARRPTLPRICAPGVSDAQARAEDGGVIVFDCRVESPGIADALARCALTAGRLLALETKHPTLEDRFIAAVTQREAAAA